MLNSVTNKGLTCVNDQKIHSLNVDSNVWFNHVDIMDSPSASGSQGRHLCQLFSLVMYNTYLQPRYSMTAGALGGRWFDLQKNLSHIWVEDFIDVFVTNYWSSHGDFCSSVSG